MSSSRTEPPRRRYQRNSNNNDDNGGGGGNEDERAFNNANRKEGEEQEQKKNDSKTTTSSSSAKQKSGDKNNSNNSNICQIARVVGAPGASASATAAFMMEPLPTYKIIVIGDAATGKSNLLTRFSNNKFDRYSKATLGIEFYSREIEIPHETRVGEVKHVIAQLWDTAGQERCGSITAAYFRNAVGVIVVYDVTRRETLLNVPRWVAHARQFVALKSGMHKAPPPHSPLMKGNAGRFPSHGETGAQQDKEDEGEEEQEECLFAVVGNKIDIPDSQNAVTLEEGEEVAHTLNARHFSASALTGEGVFEALLSVILSVNAIQSMKLARESAHAESVRNAIANANSPGIFAGSSIMRRIPGFNSNSGGGAGAGAGGADASGSSSPTNHGGGNMSPDRPHSPVNLTPYRHVPEQNEPSGCSC